MSYLHKLYQILSQILKLIDKLYINQSKHVFNDFED